MCDPAKEQTTDAAKNDRKMEPNPSTIYVATTFGVLVLCIIIVYFVVKNRRQGASYATMSDDWLIYISPDWNWGALLDVGPSSVNRRQVFSRREQVF